MSNDVARDQTASTTQRGAASTVIAWLPGTVLLCLGLWMVSDGGLGWGWMLCGLGLALVLVGGVAQGVAWGMDIHRERHP